MSFGPAETKYKYIWNLWNVWNKLTLQGETGGNLTSQYTRRWHETHLPAPGSVIAMAPIFLPAIISGMNFFCCSGEPKCSMYGSTISLCNENPGPEQFTYILERNRINSQSVICITTCIMKLLILTHNTGSVPQRWTDPNKHRFTYFIHVLSTKRRKTQYLPTQLCQE